MNSKTTEILEKYQYTKVFRFNYFWWWFIGGGYDGTRRKKKKNFIPTDLSNKIKLWKIPVYYCNELHLTPQFFLISSIIPPVAFLALFNILSGTIRAMDVISAFFREGLKLAGGYVESFYFWKKFLNNMFKFVAVSAGLNF